MKKYISTLLLLFMVLSAAHAERHEEDANNTLYSSAVTAFKGKQIVLTVNMKNNVSISGFEFTLVLPEGISLSSTVDKYGDVVYKTELSSERTDASRHIYSVSTTDSKHIKVLCYSAGAKTFAGNDGVVATFTLDISDNMEDGDYVINYKDIVMSNATDTYTTSNVQNSITVKTQPVVNYDLNGDGKVDVNDVTQLVNYILSKQ